jgi:hypothetical protein
MGNAVVINTHHLRQRSRRVSESGGGDKGGEGWHGGILPVWCEGVLLNYQTKFLCKNPTTM